MFRIAKLSRPFQVPYISYYGNPVLNPNEALGQNASNVALYHPIRLTSSYSGRPIATTFSAY